MLTVERAATERVFGAEACDEDDWIRDCSSPGRTPATTLFFPEDDPPTMLPADDRAAMNSRTWSSEVICLPCIISTIVRALLPLVVDYKRKQITMEQNFYHDQTLTGGGKNSDG
jgi:hypothetical protein